MLLSLVPHGWAQSASIQYEARDIDDSFGPGGDLWEYRYLVSDPGGIFQENIGFDVFFPPSLYRNLSDPAPPVNGDWDVLTFQPDANLASDGAYDALALKNFPRLADPFVVRFIWLGGASAIPRAQSFEVNQFDAGGNFIQTLQTGMTVPEPTTATMLLAGAGLLALRRRRRFLAVLLAGGLLAPSGAFAQASVPELTLDSIVQVREERITRTLYEYEYRARVKNSGTRRFQNVAATVTTNAAAITLSDAGVSFGDVLVKGVAQSTDTFTFRFDRRVPFDPTALQFTFAGTAVAPVAPVLSNLVAPATLVRGTAGVVTFDFADADGDISVLKFTRQDALGSSAEDLAASLAHISGASGRATLPLDSASLPFGPVELSLTLRDGQDVASQTVSFTVNITGPANTGVAPSVVAFAPEVASYDRPVRVMDRVRPRLSLEVADADDDLELLRVRFTEPGGSARLSEFPADEFLPTATGTRTGSVKLDFRSDSALGNYTIEVTPFDRNGHAGAPTTTTVQLTSFGGARSRFYVNAPNPGSGSPGDQIDLSGFGFSTTPGAETVFELGEIPCEIVSLDAFQARVIVPVGSRTGAFTATQPDGSRAVSPQNFTVVEHVVIAPDAEEMPAVSVGGTVSFSARVGTAQVDRSVAWRVNGVPGGSAALGTISPAGIYTAPAIPPAGAVQITAALTASPAVVSVATPVAVLPPVATPGEVPVLAAFGATVPAADFRSSVTIPPGALAANATITARTLGSAELPDAGPGRRTLGAAQFGPDGLTFTAPVSVTIPLTVSRLPGTALRLRFLQANGTFVDEGITALVNATGDGAVASITHFTTPTVDEAAAANPPGIAPTITSIEPTEIEENALQPLRLTGSDLTGDLRVEMRNPDGSLAGGMRPGTLVAAGDRAGFVLDTDAIRDLGESQTRVYRVRLVRAHDDALFAEIPLTVRGLPELEVSAGEHLDLTEPAPMRLSTLTLGRDARVRILSGVFNATVLGETRIYGTIDASGERGANAIQQAGGLRSRDGGAGGDGVPSSASYGQNGNDPVGVSEPFQLPPPRRIDNQTRSARGIGGAPGEDASFDPVSLVAAIVECIGTLGVACPEAVRQLIEQGQSALNVADGSTNGRRGLGAPALSTFLTTGGGGGGGGGELSVSVFILGGMNLYGGGGGAGGSGGAGVLLTTARSITGSGAFDSAAPVVDARGGDGGDGSSKSSIHVRALFFEVYSEGNVDAFWGGGGGGGRTGLVTVNAAQGVLLDSTDRLRIGGGHGGRGGVTVIDAVNSRNQESYEDSTASDAEGYRGARVIRTPIFSPLAFAPRVVGRSVVNLRSERTLDKGPLRFTVYGEGGKELTVVARFDEPTQRYEANVVLFQGFNTVTDPGLLQGNPVTAQRLLMLGIDTDGDGLTDEDEADFGTDPALADTDGDGLSDGQELAFGSDPLFADGDSDGLSDGAELAANTDPTKSDTDGDGFTDSAEVFLGSNPLRAQSVPTSIPPGTLFASSAAGSGSFLTLLNPADGRNQGLLGRPNAGLGFGLAFDEISTLYIANLTGLSEYDPLAMTARPIGSFGNDGGAPIRCTSLAYNPADHRLYGIEIGPAPDFANTAQLLRIDPFTGAATRIGAPGAYAIHALVFTRDGTLFTTADGSVNSDRFIELDPATGALIRVIGMTNAAPIYGLAITRQDVIFAAQPLPNNSSRIHTIDPLTGVAMLTTSVPRNVFDLAIKPPPAPAFTLPPVASASSNPNEFDYRFATGDLDGDGKLDAVVLSSNYFPHYVSIRRGDNTGAFIETTRFQLPGFSSDIGESVALGDLNGDGRLDILIDNPENSFPGPRGLALLLANVSAPGEFDAPVSIGTSAGLGGGLTLANVNPLDDAFLDIISGGTADHTFVTLGDGQGGFGTPMDFDAANRINGLTADMNGDGFPDLLLTSVDAPQGMSAFSIRLGDGHGTFAPEVVHVVPVEYFDRIATGDFDGDGRLDVALLSLRLLPSGDFQSELILMRQDPTGAFAASSTVVFPGFNDNVLAVGDLTGDGLADAAVVTRTPDSDQGILMVFAGRPDGTLRAGSSTLLQSGAYDLHIADANGDGRPDIIISETGNGTGTRTYLVEPSF